MSDTDLLSQQLAGPASAAPAAAEPWVLAGHELSSRLILAESCAGLRPGTPDNGPVVGGTGVDGLLLATGHYRNGILMSPVTADAIVAGLTGQPPATEWEPFTPERFTSRPAVAEGAR